MRTKMSKKSFGKKIISVILGISMIAGSLTAASFSEDIPVLQPKKNELKGVWVASVFNIDYPKKSNYSTAKLKSDAVKILDDVKLSGLNSVFLQVRPEGDALYKSEYYPWSRFLTGKQGKAPADGFDPLAFWIEEAHKRGIQIHAWINPLRVTGAPSMKFSGLSEDNPAKLNYDKGWVLKKDNKLYLDPAYPEVRQLIINGASEIAEKYDVDGIHMDDYFYPGNVNDGKSYALYGNGQNRNDWRRDNITTLIKDMSASIHRVKPDIQFGISPFGIWANKKSNRLGSDTAGNQSYYSHFADTRKWVKEGYIDYIMPQLYWHIGFKIADFRKLLNWWTDVVKGTNVKLYIGHNLNNTAKRGTPWYGGKEIIRQINLCRNEAEYKGSVYFSYSYMKKSKNAFEVLKTVNRLLSLETPSENFTTSADTVVLKGTSDPDDMLFLNDVEVEESNIDAGGNFEIAYKLKNGVNNIILSQADFICELVVTKSSQSNAKTSVKTPLEEKKTKKKISAKAYSDEPGDKGTINSLELISPSRSISVTDSAYTLVGKSDITKPLWVNGVRVGERDVSGNFKIPMILEPGSNKFNVSQGEKKISVNVTRKSVADYRYPVNIGDIPSDAAEATGKIPSYGIFPQYGVMKKTGTSVNLFCLAPPDASVTAKIAGEEILLDRQVITSNTENGPYLVKFSGKYTLPENVGSSSSKDLGNVTYVIDYSETQAEVKSKGKLHALSGNARVLATMKNTAQSYEYIQLSSGPFLSKNGTYGKGLSDFITKNDGISGSGNELLKLGVGNWVRRADVLISAKTSYKPNISDVKYKSGDRFDYIDFEMREKSTAKATYSPYYGGKGGKLTYVIENAGNAPSLNLPDKSPFSSVSSSNFLGRSVYIFTLKPGSRVDGMHTDSTDGGIRLSIKRHDDLTNEDDSASSDTSKSLGGKVILIDPGHGGSDGGARGYGSNPPNEANLVLSVSNILKKKLEDMGASVDLVRKDNSKVYLHERVNDTSTVRPDVFVSIHANSAGSSAKGFEILYRNHVSKNLAEVMCDEYIAQTGMVNRGVKYRKDLFVLHPTFVPTVLAELGFMSNKSEHARMKSNSGKELMTDALAEGILKYFRR